MAHPSLVVHRLRPATSRSADHCAGVLRDRKLASASSSASLISVLRNCGMTEIPCRTRCLTVCGFKSVHSRRTPDLTPLYFTVRALVPGWMTPGSWQGAHHFAYTARPAAYGSDGSSAEANPPNVNPASANPANADPLVTPASPRRRLTIASPANAWAISRTGPAT